MIHTEASMIPTYKLPWKVIVNIIEENPRTKEIIQEDRE